MGEILRNIKYRSTCAIAMSIDLFGDKWSLLILRDILLHRKSTVKEFSNSKERIASNILASRLVNLIETGFIYKLNTKGTIKSAIYLATPKGICALPLLVELYMFSIGYLEEVQLNESQKKIKAEIFQDKHLFMEDRREKYAAFLHQIQSEMPLNQKIKAPEIPQVTILKS